MRKLLYGLILLSVFFAPVERVDVAQLLPIRAVSLSQQGTQLLLRTDTNHLGKGKNVQDALANLQENAPAVVYLDTAQFLLVDEAAVYCLDQLIGVLKPTVRVCVCPVPEDLSAAADYLEVHGDLPKLKDYPF